MKVLFLLICFAASIYANKNYNYNVVIKNTTYGGRSLDFKQKRIDFPPELVKQIIYGNKIHPRAITSNLNNYADKVFTNIQHQFSAWGLDPYELDDVHTGFEFEFLFIRYHGELDLTKGWLYDLDSIHRGGDVIAEYSTQDKYLEVTVPIAFDDLQFDYDYSAKLMDLGPSGGIHGKIANVAVRVKLGFDLNTFQASLEEFYILDSGHIDFNFSGNTLIDWALNILSEVITTTLKEVFLLVIEGIIRGGLDSVVSAINDFVNSVLGDPAVASEIVKIAARTV